MSAAVLLFATLVVVVARWMLGYLKFRRAELSFPGPPSLPILGNALSFVGATKDDLYDRLRKLLGNRTQLTRISLLGRLILVVSEAEDIEKVVRGKDTQDKSGLLYKFVEQMGGKGLLTLNGADWKAHRKALTPAFHPELLHKYQEFFDKEAKGFVQRVKVGVAEDVIPNLKSSSARAFISTSLTFDIDEEKILPVLMEIVEVVMPAIMHRTVSPWYWYESVFALSSLGRSVRALTKKMDDLFAILMSDVRQRLRRKNGCEDFVKEKPTLIDILLEAPDDMVLSDRHIRDEVIVFTAAAIDTSASSLGWLLKTLSLRHDVQDRILAEVKEVLGTDDTVRPEHLPRLEYTERVIKESLRLTPAGVMIARGNLRQPTVFNGKPVPQGTTFLINILGVHRDPRHWDEPLKFDPDRFLPKRSKGRHQYAYLPFSVGPRNCIGSRYAMAVMKTVLVNVLSKYRVDPVDDGHTDPASFPIAVDIASRMPGGVHVVFKPREATPT